MFANEIDETQHDFLAFERSHATPDAGLERATCRSDCTVDVFDIALGHFGNEMAITRADVIEGLAGCGIDELAVDEALGAWGNDGSAALPFSEIDQISHESRIPCSFV